MPILLSLSTGLQSEESVDEDNELAETALSTLEAIIRKCPLEVNEHIQSLLSTSFGLCEYDPNYVYNDDEDEDMNDEEEDEGWGDDDFSDGGDMPEDDDDTSWKVRRSAVQIIDAIVRTRPDKVKEIINQYTDKLVDRVKERIDDVKVEILTTLQGVINTSMEVSDNSLDLDLHNKTSLMRQMSMGESLKEKKSQIVKVLLKPVKSKNMKVKVAAIETLSSYALLVGFKIDE